MYKIFFVKILIVLERRQNYRKHKIDGAGGGELYRVRVMLYKKKCFLN
jgi:hypothetical protein